MYIPGPAINIYGTPRFVARKLFADDSRIKRKPPRSATVDESKPGFLCWGVVGNLPTAAPVPEVSFAVAETHTEVSRKTTPIRIENPDDPSQHVDALQTNSIELKINEPVEEGNSATMDAVAATIEHAADNLKAHAEEIKAGRYRVVYNPPERAL